VLSSIDIFGLSLQTFGIFFALNFAAWGALAARRLRELGRPADWAYEMVFVALVGGLVGARLYYVVQNYGEVKDDLLGHLFSGSGLVWYGGLLDGALAMVVWARRRRFLGLALVDLAGPGLALGYAVGRIGCQVSGDGDYGKPSHLPWAMGYPHGTLPTPPGVRVQPTPIYETLVMGLVAWGLWRLRDRVRPGVLFSLYLLLAGTERLLVEFVRRNAQVLAGLTGPQLESIASMVLGAAGLVLIARRGGMRRAAPSTA